jgi:Tfp pilus assembly protein PilF
MRPGPRLISSFLVSFLVLFASVAVSTGMPPAVSPLVTQDGNSITGFVFDETRAPVQGIYVELQNDFYSTIARMRTTGSGIYGFRGLAPGRYIVKVVTTGTNFYEQSQSVSLVPISVIQGRGIVSEQLDFYLKAKKQPGARPLASPGVIFAQDIPAEAKAMFESGVEELNKKNETAGFENIKRAIEIFPEYFDALDRLGNEYLNRGHYQAAGILLAHAKKVNSKSFSSTFGLGIAEYRQNNFDGALVQFKEAVELDRASINAHLWLGIAHHAKKDLSRALASLTEANKLSNGESSEVHWQLARVYKDQNRYNDSADALTAFLKYRPDAPNADEIREIIKKLRTQQ